MNRIKKNPISTALGLFFIAFSIFLMFKESLYEIPLYQLIIGIAFGVLLIFAKDKVIDIITLGLSRLISDTKQKSKDPEQ